MTVDNTTGPIGRSWVTTLRTQLANVPISDAEIKVGAQFYMMGFLNGVAEFSGCGPEQSLEFLREVQTESLAYIASRIAESNQPTPPPTSTTGAPPS
jgi:hypothetical protein